MNKRIAMILLSLVTVLFLSTGVCSAASERWRDPVTGIWYDGRDPKDRTIHPEDVMPPLDNTPVRFQVSSNGDGTYNMFMRFKNNSKVTWPQGQCQLICKKGMELLPEGTGLWTIDENVPRGVEYKTNITLKGFESGKKMSFAVKCGSMYGANFWIRL